MTTRDVMAVLDALAPFDSAEEWDTVGLMVGDPSRRVETILVALDPSLEVIRAAMRRRADLLVTHHPLTLAPMNRLDLSRGVGRKVALLIEARTALVSMHTNLDKAPGGVADELALRLGLASVQAEGALRVGVLARPVALRDWLEELPFAGCRLCDAARPVSRVGACPGSGMDFWQRAHSLGCDTVVTGDVRYHAGLDAWEAGMNVVDLGHFATEEIIVKPLAARLNKELKGVRVLAHRGRDVFSPCIPTRER
ncbi:MAG TPA: Nif3-like dinuclear metal center hexameric protein [Deltaproteobacteria bacterium]|nr:Nif3-like dinuclear metal center hexameric protein [Deltaproteobacteria bacterium]HQI81918.1 Nif3-like dinuclear metal center hexameric protein [Deltaproteobacteria bacterium]